jgi:hypothetical protein
MRKKEASLHGVSGLLKFLHRMTRNKLGTQSFPESHHSCGLEVSDLATKNNASG